MNARTETGATSDTTVAKEATSRKTARNHPEVLPPEETEEKEAIDVPGAEIPETEEIVEGITATGEMKEDAMAETIETEGETIIEEKETMKEETEMMTGVLKETIEIGTIEMTGEIIGEAEEMMIMTGEETMIMIDKEINHLKEEEIAETEKKRKNLQEIEMIEEIVIKEMIAMIKESLLLKMTNPLKEICQWIKRVTEEINLATVTLFLKKN